VNFRAESRVQSPTADLPIFVGHVSRLFQPSLIRRKLLMTLSARLRLPRLTITRMDDIEHSFTDSLSTTIQLNTYYVGQAARGRRINGIILADSRFESVRINSNRFFLLKNGFSIHLERIS